MTKLEETLYLAPHYVNELSDLPKISEIKMIQECNDAESTTTAITKELNDTERNEIIDFFRMGLDGIIEDDYNLAVEDGTSLNTLNVLSEYVVRVSQKGICKYKGDIELFFQKPVYKTDDDTLYIGYGKETGTIASCPAPTVISTPTTSCKRTSSINLPKYLDKLIFGSYFRAVYRPDYRFYSYNKNLNEEELLTYLGTYFPRSYCESFCIFTELFSNEDYKQRIQKEESITILDIGCGSGGEILGLLELVEQTSPQNMPVDVYTYDGNAQAQDILMDLIGQFQKGTNTSRQIQVYTNIKEIVNESSFSAIAREIETVHFDFILCNKMCNELISRHNISDAYYDFCKCFSPCLKENGVLCILDVTTKEEDSGCFYPMILNQQVNRFTRSNPYFSTLLPLSCANHSECNVSCFTGRKFYVSHSMKDNDLSKVAFRLICRIGLQKSLISSCNYENEIINESAKATDAKAYCPLNRKQQLKK